VQSEAPGQRKPTLEVLKEIWAQRQARGMVGRSKQEIDVEINAMRDEDEKAASRRSRAPFSFAKTNKRNFEL
jgi:hypothetical protein